MPNKDEFLQSMKPGIRLDKNFFLKIYGYEISYLGFKENAIRTLEEAGCTKARAYYDEIIGEYKRQQDEQIRPVAVEYLKECNKKWEKGQKEGEESREQKKKRQMKQNDSQKWLEGLY